MKSKSEKGVNSVIAGNIRAIRSRTTLTQEDMADLLGMTRVNYVNMEAGRVSPKAIHIWNICRIFNCKVVNIFPPVSNVILKRGTVRKVIVIRKKKRFKKLT